jgi:hypothetical protein
MPRYRSQTGLVTVGRSGIHSGTTPPSPAHVGQRWFNTATAVTYQYTRGANGKFWLDISSSGIGTSAARGADWVGDTDPRLDTNGSGLAVGDIYYNREKNTHFVCTDASSGANVWVGRYAASGGTETTYLLSGTYYRVHTFLSSGSLYVDQTVSCNVLIMGGGGGGGSYSGAGGGSGGCRQLSSQSLASGFTYAIEVGVGGRGTTINTTAASFGRYRNMGSNGRDSSVIGGSYSEIGSGGGLGGSFEHSGSLEIFGGNTGGSGGGGGPFDTSTTTAGKAGNTPSKTPSQGNAGGSGNHTSGSHVHSGGGGGAGGVGGAGSGTTGGAAGVGITNSWRDGNASGTTVSTHRFGGGGAGDGNGANGASQAAYGGGAAGSGAGGSGVANSGGGGAGGNYTNGGHGGDGGSGIVVIRYVLT